MTCHKECENIEKSNKEKPTCGHQHIEFGCPSCLETKLGTCSNIHHNKENESDTPAVMMKGSSSDTPAVMMKGSSTESDIVNHQVKDGNMGSMANKGFTRDDSSTSTRLLDKNWSPLIIRKYQMFGWPMFIGIIADVNLNDLDLAVYEIMDKAEQIGFIDGTIQGARNACGFLSDELVKHYNKVKRGVMEGIIVFWYQDKLAISSAYGDLMTHEKCAMEFYSILNMMPHI